MVVMTHTLFLWRQLHVVAIILTQIVIIPYRQIYLHALVKKRCNSL